MHNRVPPPLVAVSYRWLAWHSWVSWPESDSNSSLTSTDPPAPSRCLENVAFSPIDRRLWFYTNAAQGARISSTVHRPRESRGWFVDCRSNKQSPMVVLASLPPFTGRQHGFPAIDRPQRYVYKSFACSGLTPNPPCRGPFVPLSPSEVLNPCTRRKYKRMRW